MALELVLHEVSLEIPDLYVPFAGDGDTLPPGSDASNPTGAISTDFSGYLDML
jgi:hypothetical protein